MARPRGADSSPLRNRRHTCPTTSRPHPPPRTPSQAPSESDDSASSPERTLDDDTDFFMAQANDSQSSIGVTNLREMSMSIDLEQQHRLSPISRLPPELLISIFAKLSSAADLRSCMLVSYNWAIHCVGVLWHRPQCNVWKNVINITSSLSKNPFFPYHEMVRRLNLATLHEKVNDGSIQPFMQCKRIERLTLTNCSKLTDSGVSGLVEGNKHLQALDVTDIRSLTDHTLLTVAGHCPRLQGLNLTNCSKITDESLVAVAENCRQIKRLKLNNLPLITDESIIAFAENCSSILEIDLHSCSPISSLSVTALLSYLYHLRELRLALCTGISDSAFLDLPPKLTFEYLRILDLTGCEDVRDDAICRIIPATPKLRNLVLAKCRHITDRAVAAICRLGKNLHYIHLGHCINLTDNAVIGLVKACNRIRYIDLACCNRLTDQSVQHLAQLPKLRRIGLVKCQQLTDQSIFALARGAMSGGPAHPRPGCLERVHLSYCVSLTLQGIHELLQYCPRLTHLSLTGVQAFLREDLTRFCREAPPEFTHPQRDVFCVFSGEGVSRLREYLKRLAEDQEREGRASRDTAATYSEPEAEGDSSRDTVSDDGTIDAAEEITGSRPILRPRSAGYRSYAEVVSGSGSNSPERKDVAADDDDELPLLGAARHGRISSIFGRRSSRSGSFAEHDDAARMRRQANGQVLREASRSVSEGQGSSSRSRFTPSEAQSSRSRLARSEVPTFDGYFSSMADAQSRRVLPPRPHWPPQAQTAQFFDGDRQIVAPESGESSTAMRATRQGAGTGMGLGLGLGRSGIHGSREDSAASAVYDDSDDDGEMTVRQSSLRAHGEIDGEMGS